MRRLVSSAAVLMLAGTLVSLAGGSNTNQPPTASPDEYSISHTDVLNEPMPGVLGNDTDPEGDLLAAQNATTPQHGTVGLSGDGSFSYDPSDTFVGDDSFQYDAVDVASNVSTGAVTIHVTNAAPVATDDTGYSVSHSGSINGAASVLDNDTDADGDLLSAQEVLGPAHGTVTLNTDGTFDYTPDVTYVGPDSFTYYAKDDWDTSATVGTVSIDVTNESPSADADGTYTGIHDTQLQVFAPGVLDGDTDADGDSLVAENASTPGHGSVTLDPDGGFTYSPDPGYVGQDTFTYTASDGIASSSSATVTVDVTNDNVPSAGNDDYSTSHLSTLNVTAPGVLSNDTDGDLDPLKATNASLPAHGTVTLNDDGSFDYTPSGTYVGSDSFTYDASDGADSSSGTVTIDVTNAKPSATDDTGYSVSHTGSLSGASTVLGNDSDLDNELLSAAVDSPPSHAAAFQLNDDGTFDYTPSTSYVGQDTFTYTASDGLESSAPATVYIDVTNQEPCTCGDEYSISHDDAIIQGPPGVLANDTDGDGDTLTAVLETDVSHGTLTLDSDGGFSYDPDDDFAGDDSFTYRADDGLRAFGPAAPSVVPVAAVTIHVTSQAPTVANDAYANAPNTQLNVTAPGILGNDSDPDPGDTLSATYPCGTTPQHGTVTVYSDGSFTYDPDTGYGGLDSFGYGVEDQTGTAASGCGTVTINMGGTTAVVVASSSATGVASGTLVRWRTGTEAAIAAFRIYRERNGRRVLASKVIAATGGTRGRSYSWLDRGARAKLYWLRVLHVGGRATWYGPIRAP